MLAHIMSARHLDADFFMSAFGHIVTSSDVAEGQHLFSFSLRRPSATPRPGLPKPCVRCGRRPTFIFFLFPCVGLRPRQDWVFQNQASDVAEGRHLFSSRRPSATPRLKDRVFQNQASDVAEGQHLFAFFFLASAFGHAETWVLKPGVRCGRRPT